MSMHNILSNLGDLTAVGILPSKYCYNEQVMLQVYKTVEKIIVKSSVSNDLSDFSNSVILICISVFKKSTFYFLITHPKMN